MGQTPEGKSPYLLVYYQTLSNLSCEIKIGVKFVLIKKQDEFKSERCAYC
jgi:hypothetical protein